MPNQPLHHLSRELGSIVFQHLIGSNLIGAAGATSDTDWFSGHKTVIFNSSERLGNFSQVHHADFQASLVETSSFDLSQLVHNLTHPKDVNYQIIFSKILSHLYAVKYQLVVVIKDKAVYDLYLDWLKSPGWAINFWGVIRSVYWTYLDNIPDQECNWSQKFDGSNHHANRKAAWDTLHQATYPTVNTALGYDAVYARRAFQDLFVIKSILLPNSPITEEQKQFLHRLRAEQVSFDEYRTAKKLLWKQTRLALESIHQLYFLGEGDSLEQSMAKKLFGVRGLCNFMDHLLEIKNS